MHMTGDEAAPSEFDKVDIPAVNGAIHGLTKNEGSNEHSERSGEFQV